MAHADVAPFQVVVNGNFLLHFKPLAMSCIVQFAGVASQVDRAVPLVVVTSIQVESELANNPEETCGPELPQEDTNAASEMLIATINNDFIKMDSFFLKNN